MESGDESTAARAQERVRQAGEVQGKCLRAALIVLVQKGPCRARVEEADKCKPDEALDRSLRYAGRPGVLPRAVAITGHERRRRRPRVVANPREPRPRDAGGGIRSSTARRRSADHGARGQATCWRVRCADTCRASTGPRRRRDDRKRRPAPLAHRSTLGRGDCGSTRGPRVPDRRSCRPAAHGAGGAFRPCRDCGRADGTGSLTNLSTKPG